MIAITAPECPFGFSLNVNPMVIMLNKSARNIGRPTLAILALLAHAKPAAAESHDPPLSEHAQQYIDCVRLGATLYLHERSSDNSAIQFKAQIFTDKDNRNSCGKDPEFSRDVNKSLLEGMKGSTFGYSPGT